MTSKPVVQRPLARQDVNGAIDRYLREANQNTALKFITSLERAFRHISRYPTSGSPRYALELHLPGLRSWPVHRFPYVIFYVEAADYVDVWRVLHAERDIPAWMTPPDEE